MATRNDHEKHDLDFARSLFQYIREQGADIILCLHNAHRYTSSFLKGIRDIADKVGGIEIREKDKHPDNLADLIASDVMVSNLSSFITYEYVLGAPTVHICPTTPGKRSIAMAVHRHGHLKARVAHYGESLWMTSPEDNGGITAFDIFQTEEAIMKGLKDPSCCTTSSHDWLTKHVDGIDGHTCERFANALREFAARPVKVVPIQRRYQIERKLRNIARHILMRT